MTRVRSRNPSHEATSANACAIYPFVADSGAWAPGVYIGQDCLGGGGAFRYDPWQLCEGQFITGPNLCIVGQLGRGKSALRKSYVFRQMAFGREALTLDPKGEDGALCQLLGVEPIRLEPGGQVRLNPLDAALGTALRTEREVRGERLAMLYAVIGAVLGRSLTAEERCACRVGLSAAEGAVGAAQPTLPDVARAMFHPAESAAASFGLTARQLSEASRGAAMALEELVEGVLAGMFDGPTTPRLRLGGPLTSFDLSAVRGSELLGILIVCAATWVQKLLCRSDGVKRILVLDEAWACLRSLQLAHWLQGAYKLARAYGYQCVAVLHRFSDLAAAGAEGSEQVAIARGLLSDSETQVVFAQSAAEVARTRELLGLTGAEASVLTSLPRGRALWRVGTRSFVVQLELSPDELAFCETDGALAEMTATDASEVR